MNDQLIINGVTYVRKEEPVEKKARVFEVYENSEGLFLGESIHGMQAVKYRGESPTFKFSVREVLEGEVVVTREKLASAWDKYAVDGQFFDESSKSQKLKLICKALGFKE